MSLELKNVNSSIEIRIIIGTSFFKLTKSGNKKGRVLNPALVSMYQLDRCMNAVSVVHVVKVV
jgi:hypothetical protein